MLTWASLVLAVLKLAITIMNYFDQEALIKAGYDKAFAEAGQEIMRKTAAGKAILEKVSSLSDSQVDDELHKLEP